jgi:hypothetical protein
MLLTRWSVCGNRPQETAKINVADLPEDERHAALQQLLHKETKLLQTIVRLKIAANAENRDVRITPTPTPTPLRPKAFDFVLCRRSALRIFLHSCTLHRHTQLAV